MSALDSSSSRSGTGVRQTWHIVIPSKYEDVLKLWANEQEALRQRQGESDPYSKETCARTPRVPCISHPRQTTLHSGTSMSPLFFNNISSLKALGDVLSHDVYGEVGERSYLQEYHSASQCVYQFLWKLRKKSSRKSKKRRLVEYGQDNDRSSYELQQYWSKLNCWKRIWNCESRKELEDSLYDYTAQRTSACFSGEYAAQRTLRELKCTDGDWLPTYLSGYAHYRSREEFGKTVLPQEPHVCMFHAPVSLRVQADAQEDCSHKVLFGSYCVANPDLIGCKKFMFLITMRRELIVANAWISTLGGGYYLCKHIEQARIMAKKQILVAKLLEDESMEAKANVHFVYNDILERKFDQARVRIRGLRKIGKRLGDTELLKMLKASKLYCNKVEELDKTGILHRSKRASGQSHPLLPQTEESYESDLALSDDFYRQRPIQ